LREVSLRGPRKRRALEEFREFFNRKTEKMSGKKSKTERSLGEGGKGRPCKEKKGVDANLERSQAPITVKKTQEKALRSTPVWCGEISGEGRRAWSGGEKTPERKKRNSYRAGKEVPLLNPFPERKDLYGKKKEKLGNRSVRKEKACSRKSDSKKKQKRDT